MLPPTSTPFVAVYALDKGTFKATVARTKEHQRRLLLFHEIPLPPARPTAQMCSISPLTSNAVPSSVSLEMSPKSPSRR